MHKRKKISVVITGIIIILTAYSAFSRITTEEQAYRVATNWMVPAHTTRRGGSSSIKANTVDATKTIDERTTVFFMAISVRIFGATRPTPRNAVRHGAGHGAKTNSP